MTALIAITRTSLKRLVADRANIFFLIILPLMLIFALGASIGGSGSKTLLGVVDQHPTAASRALAAGFRDNPEVELRTVTSEDALRADIARRTLDGGWVLDGDKVRWYGGLGQGTTGMRGVLERAAQAASLDAAVPKLVAERAGVGTAQAQQAVAEAAVTPIRVIERDSQRRFGASGSERAVLAAGELTLFVFLSSLMGAQAVLLTRLSGVGRRMRAAPVSARAIVAGEALGRFAVAAVQSLIIVLGSALLFGVDWQSPLAVAALCAAMGLVGSGAALLLAQFGRTEQQVAGVALLLSLSMAALGGSMVPLHFFPDTMRTIAFAVTPHAWMNDALWSVLVDGKGIGGVLLQLGVLTGVGIVLLTLASRQMLRRL